jgi:pimeloyl-ACP methyl ester carboxylesterase
MNQLGISRAAFVGNSWGGGYALYFAERHPDRVTKYVSLDGTGLNLDDTGGSLIWKFAKVPVIGEIVFELGSGRSDVRKYLTDTLIRAPVTDDMVTEYYLPYRIHANLVSQWTFERNLDWLQTERLLPRLIAPTLIVWGRQDKTLLPELYLPRWKALKPNARIEAIDQAGHLVHVDQPEQVAKLILQFLDS